jgi:hypothetical protein
MENGKWNGNISSVGVPPFLMVFVVLSYLSLYYLPIACLCFEAVVECVSHSGLLFIIECFFVVPLPFLRDACRLVDWLVARLFQKESAKAFALGVGDGRQAGLTFSKVGKSR